MRWVQWKGQANTLSAVHATSNGKRGLCGRALTGPFILDSETKPRTKHFCELCAVVVAEEAVYQKAAATATKEKPVGVQSPVLVVRGK